MNFKIVIQTWGGMDKRAIKRSKISHAVTNKQITSVTGALREVLKVLRRNDR